MQPIHSMHGTWRFLWCRDVVLHCGPNTMRICVPNQPSHGTWVPPPLHRTCSGKHRRGQEATHREPRAHCKTSIKLRGILPLWAHWAFDPIGCPIAWACVVGSNQRQDAVEEWVNLRNVLHSRLQPPKQHLLKKACHQATKAHLRSLPSTDTFIHKFIHLRSVLKMRSVLIMCALRKGHTLGKLSACVTPCSAHEWAREKRWELCMCCAEIVPRREYPSRGSPGVWRF